MSDQKAASDAKAGDKQENKPKGPPPILRGVREGQQNFGLWAHEGDAKTGGHGFYKDQAGKVVHFAAFFNEREVEVDGVKIKKMSIRLSGSDGKDEATGKDKHKTLGYGNAVNSHKDGDPVYFDTVVFNVGNKEDGTAQTFSARVTKACTQELRDKIGFTQAQIERPKKEREAEAAAEGQGDGDASEGEQAPRARERSAG